MVLDAEASLAPTLCCCKFVEFIFETAKLKKCMRARSRSAQDESGADQDNVQRGVYCGCMQGVRSGESA